MAHSGWAKVLVKEGYVIQHKKSSRHNFSGGPGVDTQIFKDGKELLCIAQNWDGKGGHSISEIYRKCCEDLGVVPKSVYCPEGPVELEITEEGESPHRATLFNHPSFGQISINRYQGRSKQFMSPVDTHGGMSIQIHSAELSHSEDLGTDTVFTRRIIAEVTMSFTQFAEMITAGGTAVPCTLRYVDGVHVDPFPEMPTALDRLSRTMNRDMKDAVKDMGDTLRELDAEMSGPGGLSAGRKKEVWERIKKGLQTMEGKPSWLMKMWKENADKILTHAKGEFVAWADMARQHKGHALEGFDTQKALSSGSEFPEDTEDGSK